jgi:hypothetical protein
VRYVPKTEHSVGGFAATGEIRRMSDGALISTAEGFVGEDEATWFGGTIEKDEWVNKRKTGKKIATVLPKRPDYAIRAMCQTRAMSRAGRSAFAHVVVMMNVGLDTAPAEEVQADNAHYEERREPYTPTEVKQPAPNPETMFEPDPEVTEANWREIINTGTKTESRRKPIGELPRPYVEWFLSHEPEHAGKGMVDFWKKNPAAFGPEERKVWTAMVFAMNSHHARKAAEAAGETPAPAAENPAASKDAFSMLVKMINKSGYGTTEILKAAHDLAITQEFTDEPTDAEAQEMIAHFSEIVDHLKGDK